MEYRIICKYYSVENQVIEIGKIQLPEKPKPGETIFIEDDNGIRIFVVLEVIRQYYKSTETEGEILSKDVYVHEVMYAPFEGIDDSRRLEVKADGLKTGGNIND
ncbi:hypothetical protein [Dehalobacter sp. TeCB1]|uniref:hypothetical protein n=1 Tax=Dehalobacter sp. TeCB1 TaxID=1843715 RepID=UPI00083A72AE|nr:hypothetical protein [Dehalobacter sp. TeCB1]OCZ54317.1 hypothetical protein A7D23_05990 [Dehalobacter sp. TeCB1]